MTTCPVCKAKAEEIELGTIDGKIFRCLKHGDFAVANSVFCVLEFANASEHWWEVAFKRATSRAAGKRRPKILTYDF